MPLLENPNKKMHCNNVISFELFMYLQQNVTVLDVSNMLLSAHLFSRFAPRFYTAKCSDIQILKMFG